MVKHKCKKGASGFTLVEVLIAMTILTIGLLAISQMQITALQATSFSHSVSVTNSLASGVLDSILAWDQKNPSYANLTSDGTYVWDFDPLTAGVQNTVTLAGAGTYTATYTVDADAPKPDMATITVTVRGGGVGGLLQGSGLRQRTLVGQRIIQ